MKRTLLFSILTLVLAFTLFTFFTAESFAETAGHGEAPKTAADPLADITDLYAFRSPDDTNTVTIIANCVPFQTPSSGPIYGQFGENVRYEIHIENDGSTGDDITYRFTFTKNNEDPTTFFNIRLGQQNLKTTYLVEKSINGGPFSTIVSNGVVPPPNIGPRSISDPTVGLGAANYDALISSSVAVASGGGGELLYCGPAEDPFFMDFGGIFDLAQTRDGGTGVHAPADGLACKNIQSIVIKVPIATLQRNGQPVTSATSILDGDYVIGVWASASRQQTRVLNGDGTETHSGPWVQVSRVGMPHTNTFIIPFGIKDKWNSLTPYTEDPTMEEYFCNPELGLYMDASLFGGAFPALNALRVQRNSLQSFDFGNTHDGLWPIRATNGGAGTALDTNLFGNYLLRQSKPRSVDILPMFYTGIPNLAPYQLATGKNGNPLANGKPFINNWLPTFGDMLRLNMAVPVTPRTDPNFSSMGLVQACILGITDAAYNASAALQFIPNMDGFPNGRRLEDDVTRIELQAASGYFLSVIGFWYDDYVSGNPITPAFIGVANYTTGVEQNDTTFKTSFPYVQAPWQGYGRCGASNSIITSNNAFGGGWNTPTLVMMQNYPNPANTSTTIKYHVASQANVNISIFDTAGRLVTTLVNENKAPGIYEVTWQVSNVSNGMYVAQLSSGSAMVQSVKIAVQK